VTTAVQVADGVWRIPTAPQDLVNSLLLEDADGTLTLVDAGTKKAAKTILAALDGLGRKPQDVRRLVLTHAHPDHAGGLASVQQATGGEVLAHDREAVYLREGQAPKSDTSTFGGRLLNRLPGGSFTRVEVARTFADGELLDVAGGLRVVHTPGHSPGHVSLVHEPTGVLFTGDAVFNVRGLRYPPRMLCTDVRLTHETAARLGDLDFGVAVFTHGAHLSSGAREAVRAFVAGRPR
jgi:glyoxylase-like metal-dependent hydrolase (beta-lactamase superfamily II)